MKLSKAELRKKVHRKLHPIGWLVYLSGAARYHDDGDTIGVVFRWWHPVSWLLVLALIIPCAVMGERIGDTVPFRLSKYWRENRDRLNRL